MVLVGAATIVLYPSPKYIPMQHATTSHAIKHLHDAHGIAEDGKISTNQTTLPTKPQIDPAVLRKLISEWVIDRRHSFNEIEAESF